MQFTIHSIGSIHRSDGKVLVCVDPVYRTGLQGIGGHSHIVVYWWALDNDSEAVRQTLLVHPKPLPDAIMGVFATRSPRRPNLIMATTCRLLKVDEDKGVLEIENIDAFDGTPLIDIKCYSPGIDRVAGKVRSPWKIEHEHIPDGGVSP